MRTHLVGFPNIKDLFTCSYLFQHVLMKEENEHCQNVKGKIVQKGWLILKKVLSLNPAQHFPDCILQHSYHVDHLTSLSNFFPHI